MNLFLFFLFRFPVINLAIAFLFSKVRLFFFITFNFGRVGECLYLPILIVSFALQSCSAEKEEPNELTTENIQNVSKLLSLPLREVISNVICENDSLKSYSIYLPSNYSIKSKSPVIISFDPHASGITPVSLYKNNAEKYGYIIVGSNNLQNGISWDESQNIANILIADIRKRLSINEQRIYLMGFSGGARVANAITIKNGAIEGVICCGASIPVAKSNLSRTNYSFIGIVGNEDFNYIEMRKYDMVELAGYNSKHCLLTFDGKHEWPAEGYMDEAFLWLELNELRKNRPLKIDTVISNSFNEAIMVLNKSLHKKATLETYIFLRKIINFYDGLFDLSICYSNYKLLQKNSEIGNELKQEEIIWATEENLKQEYLKAFQTQNIGWWSNSISMLNKKINSNSEKNMAQMNKRLLNFLSLASYMQTIASLNKYILPSVEFYSKIFLMLDPKNFEAHYLRAVFLIQKGDNKGAVKSLGLAIKNNFTDIYRMQNDSSFSLINKTPEFEALINEIKIKSIKKN